ncbi:MAG: tetraacyldisaccharide 4'-kinase [Muribaculaceae bacterium]|nr:tetraacyldisaccharide 4'-kinase [Muribaculaceae bacterium]
MNKQQRKAVLNAILTPFSWVYGAGVWVRNMAFNWGLLKQESFDVPVVSVGNITVGGTGKTPHVEYIIEALCRRYKIGVLSRGYKRSTKGFILATDSLSPKDIGDEPYQIFHKYNGLITLAVCEDRRKGIREMMAIDPDINLFILDDAFQHRYVKPKVNIVLVDYTRPPFEDKLLPLGQLREPMDRLVNCDIVVVTKCPSDLSPVDIRTMKENLSLFPYQELFFSNIRYADPVPVFPVPNPQLASLSWLKPEDTVLCVTGIANAKPLVRYLRQYAAQVKVMHYDDHHYFTRKDFADIFNIFDSLEGRRKFIVTTEKDMVRILNNPYYPPTMRDVIYYIPIRVGILENDGHEFIPNLLKKIEDPT